VKAGVRGSSPSAFSRSTQAVRNAPALFAFCAPAHVLPHAGTSVVNKASRASLAAPARAFAWRRPTLSLRALRYELC